MGEEKSAIPTWKRRATVAGKLAGEAGHSNFQDYVVAIGLAHPAGSWQCMATEDKDCARDLFAAANAVARQKEGI